jgi:hypothetical protein
MFKKFACAVGFLFCSASAYADDGVWPHQVLRFDFVASNFVDEYDNTTPPQSSVTGSITIDVIDRMSVFGSVTAVNMAINGRTYTPSDLEWYYIPNNSDAEIGHFYISTHSPNSSATDGVFLYFLSDPNPLNQDVKMQYSSLGTYGLYTAFDVTGGITDVTPAVPEPETYAMMLAGLSMVGFLARRRQRQTSPNLS